MMFTTASRDGDVKVMPPSPLQPPISFDCSYSFLHSRIAGPASLGFSKLQCSVWLWVVRSAPVTKVCPWVVSRRWPTCFFAEMIASKKVNESLVPWVIS